MASLLYRNHPIIVSAASHRYTNRWTWSAVVTWSENDRQKLHPIKSWFQQFDSKADAESCAIEAAKAWIDHRIRLASLFYPKLTLRVTGHWSTSRQRRKDFDWLPITIACLFARLLPASAGSRLRVDQLQYFAVPGFFPQGPSRVISNLTACTEKCARVLH